MNTNETTKILLPESEMPKQWYNLAADIPGGPKPPLGPDGKPVDPQMMEVIFPGNIVAQEMSIQRWIDIPSEVLDILSMWRPTPLRRARRLEKLLGTPAQIYYKDESVSPAGSHKPNTAIPQVFYNKVAGIRRLTTETGAGQWGSALSFACAQFGLEAKIFMVRVSYDQKPFRKTMMAVWGGKCVPSPSSETQAGRDILAKDPQCPGSLGIAISEAIEAAVSDSTRSTRYSLGSVLNHVMLHQTVIGLEARRQLHIAGIRKPDVVIGCAGGGSNFAGLAFPFVQDKLHGSDIDIIPVEPEACPTLTRGPYVYDHGDVAKMTPLLAMHSLGHAWVPPPLHAGGLRYHGMSPLVSQATVAKLLQPKAVNQISCFEAAIMWARCEGFIPAPETSHAIAAVIAAAKQAKDEGKAKVILFCYSGHGLMDLSSYEKYLSGSMSAQPLPESELQATIDTLKNHPRP